MKKNYNKDLDNIMKNFIFIFFALLTFSAIGQTKNYVCPRSSDFSYFGNGQFKFDKDTVTYSIMNFTPDIPNAALQEEAIDNAYKSWGGASGITFIKLPNGDSSAQSQHVFTQTNHDLRLFPNDNTAEDPDFDGEFGVIAHAFSPALYGNGEPFPNRDDQGTESIAGDVHYEEAERWTNNPNATPGIDLESVALHEIGHTLGIDHSDDPNAIMFFQINEPIKRVLSADDTAAVQGLYGEPKEVIASLRDSAKVYSVSGGSSFKIPFIDAPKNVVFGNFDNDENTEALKIEGSTWFVQNLDDNTVDTLMNRTPLTVTNTIPGDFDADSVTELFYIRLDDPLLKDRWVSWYTHEPIGDKGTLINASTETIDVFKVGDFSGDGKQDIFSIIYNEEELKHEWVYSSRGVTKWIRLNTELNINNDSLVLGHFNSNDTIDVMYNTNASTVIFNEGTELGTTFNRVFSMNNVIVADFNGDGIDDIFTMEILNDFANEWVYYDISAGIPIRNFITDEDIEIKISDVKVFDINSDGIVEIIY